MPLPTRASDFDQDLGAFCADSESPYHFMENAFTA